MGVRLYKLDAYKVRNYAGEKILLKGVAYFNLPADEEKYLLSLGYFHYVPEPGQVVPKNVAIADKNINGRLAGTLDGNGKPLKKTSASDTDLIDLPESEELRVDLDAKGNPVISKPGSSCLGNDGVEQFIKPPKARKGVRKLKVADKV